MAENIATQVKFIFEDYSQNADNTVVFEDTILTGESIHDLVYKQLYENPEIPWISKGSEKGTNPIPNSYTIDKIFFDGKHQEPNYRFDDVNCSSNGVNFKSQNKVYTDRVKGDHLIVKIKYHSPSTKY